MEREHDDNSKEQVEFDKEIEYSIAPASYKVESITKKEWSDQGSSDSPGQEHHPGPHHHQENHHQQRQQDYEEEYAEHGKDTRYEDVPSTSSVDGAYSTLYPTSSSDVGLVAVESGVYPVMAEEGSFESHNQRGSSSVYQEGSVVTPLGDSSELHSPVHFDVENYPQDVMQPAMMTLESTPRPETTRERSNTGNRDENVSQAENEELNSTPTAHPDIRLQEVLKNSIEQPIKNGICVQLNGQQLWRTFYDLGTEMIITKVGRRMFPAIRVKVKGLKPNRKYIMALDIEAVDDNRYRYVYHSSKSEFKWMVAGTADNPVPPRVYIHPESPQTGDSWMRQNSLVSFDKLKLTNNENDTHGHMILHSMHKYQPRIHIIEILDENIQPNLNFQQRIDTEAPGVTTFVFPETQFITVTAYQNQQITRLKIDRNPFAKGFRNSGRNNKAQYDQNAAPLPGTYAHHAASRLAYQSSSTGGKAAQDYTQSTMTTPVTWTQSAVPHQAVYPSDLSSHRKYTHHHPAHQYPSIQSLSSNIQLAYADPRYPETYSGYTLPTPAVGLQEDKQLEVTVHHQGAFRSSGSSPAIHNPHSHPRQSAKRHLTQLPSVSDHYCKEPRYEEEYPSQDSPTIQPTDPSSHLHTPQTHLYFSQ